MDAACASSLIAVEQGATNLALGRSDVALVGGVYGVSLGSGFFGESMFYRERDASKAALAALVWQIEEWGFDLLDCQMHTEHLARLGASEWPRYRFLRALERSLERPTHRGKWQLTPGLVESKLGKRAKGVG